MGCLGKIFKAGAVLCAVLAVFVGLVLQLDQYGKYEVLSRALYPLFRFLWITAIFPNKVFLKPIDDSDFRYMGMATPEEIRAWRLGSGDVVVSTWAKSGTHLAGQTTLQVLSEASDLTGDAMETLHHFALVPEILVPSLLANCEDKRILHLHNYRELRPLGNHTLFLTHMDRAHTPLSQEAKYLVMVRDPLDVLVSLHTMISKMLGRLGPTLEEVLVIFERGQSGWGPWVREWWKHRDDDNVLFYFYEDAVKDPAAFVGALTKFLGKKEDPKVLERVLSRQSVAYMKVRPEVFDPPKCSEMPIPIKNPYAEGIMVNKGKSGGGKNAASAALREYIRDYCRKTFEGTDFPIERWPGCN